MDIDNLNIDKYGAELTRLLAAYDKARNNLIKAQQPLGCSDLGLLCDRPHEAQDMLIKMIDEHHQKLEADQKAFDAIQNQILRTMKPYISEIYDANGFPDPFEDGFDIHQQVRQQLDKIGYFGDNIQSLREALSCFRKTFPWIKGYIPDREAERKLRTFHGLLEEVKPFVHDSFELARNLNMYRVEVRNRSLLKENIGFGLVYAAELAGSAVLFYLSSKDATLSQTLQNIGMLGGSGMLLIGITYMFAAGQQGRFYYQLKGQAEKTQNLIERIKETS